MIETVPGSLRRSAARLHALTLFGIAVVAAASLFAAWVLATGQSAGEWILFEVDSGGLPGMPAALLQLTTGALLIVALLHLARMLRGVADGAPFGATHLRRFALFLFLSVLVSILGPPLFQIAAGLGGGGARQVIFSLGGGEALMLFVSGLLFLVARLLDEAQRIADDASQIV